LGAEVLNISIYTDIYRYILWQYLGVEFKAWCLLGRCFTTWVILPVLFVLIIFEIGSHFMPVLAWTSYLHFPV
jgi:hypothetical protein